MTKKARIPRVRIYRHPQCARCAKIARFHERLDWLGRFESATGLPPDGVRLRRGEIYVEDIPGGTRVRGAPAFALLARQIPAYWWILPLLRIPAIRRWVAAQMDAPGEEDCRLTNPKQNRSA